MSAVPGIQAWPAAPLAGKVVLVTGGANGVGRGIAQAVLGAGGRVLIGDLDVEAGQACLAEWQRGDDAAFQPLDIADEASVQAFIEIAQQRFGRIDGLVNNAGIAAPHGTPLAQMPWEE
ncbi:MAG: Dihydroanticapsin 7-dehydrogenase [Stenotrophomonas maltophilia]|uniref:Dihydroanticapsin 7-dehydrogenase n=1 Tax=Stenotrophomonas maltophilia TaxID=40324 RepID=A0A7V8FG53_STEMA|nr:MAG: Dihydroanticapsin 7-dehydrogenase [Stenotrophomonas maltophilia]